jgi:archaemetzincin
VFIDDAESLFKWTRVIANYRPPFHRARPLSLALTLLPCGAVEREELRLAKALTTLGVLVTIAKEQPIPSAAFNSRRRQYRADDFLTIARNQPADRVLVLTNCDLYADNLNFVFGLAESFGRCAVISFFRLRIGADEEKFRGRAVKEAIHELGHTFGLSHCPNSHCVMYFSNALEDTDRKGDRWCEKCEKRLYPDRGQARFFREQGG